MDPISTDGSSRSFGNSLLSFIPFSRSLNFLYSNSCVEPANDLVLVRGL